MTKDPNLLKVFPKPPMLAFKQPPNLKSMLVRAKLATNSRPSRINIGTHQCGNSCPICSYISTSKVIKSTKTGENIQINSDFSCKTKGVIYLTTCTKCKKQYVGQTFRRLSDRIKEHIYDIKNNKDKISGIHYNSPGHSLANFRVEIIEKVIPNTTHILLEREKFWIQKLNTVIPHGLNSH